LIVLTAGNQELRRQDEDMVTAMAVIGGGALVLVVAHFYSGMVAYFATTSANAPCHVWLEAIIDQLTIAIPASIAVFFYALSYAGAYTSDNAFIIVYSLALGALFVTGFEIGYHRHKVRPSSFALGLAIGCVNVVIGGLIGLLEQLAG
jgi:cellobiose-specific phosphotransferase system component IIC